MLHGRNKHKYVVYAGGAGRAMAFLATSFEIPDQDFYEIQTRILALKSSEEDCLEDDDLHLDPLFPPDITSLTYVYSGDDKYERMTFKRPKVGEKFSV